MNTSSTGSSGARVGLRIQLAAAFAALAGALAIALSLVLGHYASEVAREQIGRYLTRLAIEFRDKLDTSLRERMEEVETLARLDVALPDASAPERRRARIDELMRNRDYAWIGYAGAAGRVEVASGRLLEGADVSARPWFGAARERPSLLDAHEAAMLAKLLPASAEPRRFVDLAVPLGAGRGVVAAHVDFTWTARLRADIESYAPQSGPFELLLLQSDGTVLIGPSRLVGTKIAVPLGVRAGAPATVTPWPDGGRYLAGGSVSRGIGGGLDLGWISIARMRQEVAFAPVADLQDAILWAGLALALAGIGAGWLLAGHLARPLESLAAAAGEVAAGKHRAAMPRLRDNLEVARLSEALRGMLSHLREQAETLRESQDHLEQRVRERTAELVALQAQLELEIADTMVARDDTSRAYAQLSLALEASQLALWDFDVATDRIYLGPYWAQMLGGAAAETRTTSRELLALVPEADLGRVREALSAALTGATPDYRVEHPVRRPDGSVFWIASVGRVVERDADGRALRLVGTNRDITSFMEAGRAGRDQDHKENRR
jgi:PAS domain S-box-containing protein